jgi:hypothetical protein
MIDETKYTKEEMPDGKIVFTPIPEKRAGLWRPKIGEFYWSVTDTFGSFQDKNESTLASNYRIKYGNCYRTEDQSIKAAALKRSASIFISAALNADPDAGEWREDRQLAVVRDNDKLLIIKASITQSLPVYVHNQAQAEHMLEILKAEGWK